MAHAGEVVNAMQQHFDSFRVFGSVLLVPGSCQQCLLCQIATVSKPLPSSRPKVQVPSPTGCQTWASCDLCWAWWVYQPISAQAIYMQGDRAGHKRIHIELP